MRDCKSIVSNPFKLKKEDTNSLNEYSLAPEETSESFVSDRTVLTSALAMSNYR